MNYRHLDLSLLRTLVAISELETFASAAEVTNKTQSAITQQMQRLEDQVGAVLFEKHGRGKRLTPQGRHLLEYARQMLSLNDEVLRSIQDRQLTGSLRIGGLQDVADTVLPSLLECIARAYPMIQMHIHVGRNEELNQMLKKGALDLTLGTRSDPALREVVVRSSPTVWICAAHFVYDRHKPLPLIVGDETSLFRSIALDALSENKIPWRLAYYTQSLYGVKAAVRAGLGIAARSVESMEPDMRTLGDKEGLPRLPNVNYRLCMRREVLDSRILRAYELIIDSLGLS